MAQILNGFGSKDDRREGGVVEFDGVEGGMFCALTRLLSGNGSSFGLLTKVRCTLPISSSHLLRLYSDTSNLRKNFGL